MMTRHSVTLFLVLLCLADSLHAQQMAKRTSCDLDVLKAVDSSMANLTPKLVEAFLLTIDSTCNGNAEFSEWSNELLFKVLLARPADVLRILERNPRVDVQYILNELASPLLDPDIDQTRHAVQAIRGHQKSKTRVLHALEEAQRYLQNP